MKKTEVNLQCKKCFKSYIFLDDLIDCLFDFFLTDENAGKIRNFTGIFYYISSNDFTISSIACLLSAIFF